MRRSEVPRSPTLRIELRGTRFWKPAFMLCVVSLLVFAELAVARFVLGLELRAALLQRLFSASIVAAPVSLVLALALRPRARDAIECFGEHLEVPAYRGSRRRRRIRYRDVYSIQSLPWGPLRALSMGRRGRLAAGIPLRWLASPGDAARLEAEIRARIALLPEGAERLRRIDRCASVWAAAGRGAPWITWGLGATLVGAFLFELAVGATTENLRLLALGGLSPILVGQGDLDRLFIPAFLHSGPLHLITNLSGLVMLGLMFERLLGWPRFLLALTLGQILGAALWVRWPNGVAAVGASAVLYGLVGCWLLLHLRARGELPSFFRVPVWWWLLILALGVWTEVELANLATAAHVGGFVGGFVAAAAVVHRPLAGLRTNVPRWLSALAASSIVAWLVALGVGVQRALGPIDERTVETARRLLDAPELPPRLRDELAAALTSFEGERPHGEARPE